MRIALKLAVAMSPLITLILLALAVFTMRREVSIIEDDLRRDALLIAEALSVSAEQSLSSPEGSVQLWLDHLAEREPEIASSWLPLQVLPEDVRAVLETGRPYASPLPPEARRVVAFSPVRTRGRLVGAVKVEEGTSLRDAYVARAQRSTVLSIALVLLATLVTSVLAGRTYVGVRVETLVRAARRIGAGDLSHRTSVGGSDELSELGEELDRMTTRLEEARRDVLAATEARLAAELHLLHAQRLSTVGRLASGVAHELGTPLNVILGRASRIVGRSGAGGGEEETLRDAEIVRDQARRLSDLVRQLLDLARGAEPTRRDVDLHHLGRSSLEVLAPLARERGVRLVLSGSEGPCPASADPTQIGQVMTNLLLNAIQATRPGGEVLLELGLDGSPSALAEPGTWTGFVVRDQGVGIGSEAQALVFEPFYTTKDPGEGTGLGLSVAQKIVEAHGGKILLDTAVGEGSCFAVLLPPAAPTPSGDA